MTNTNMNNKKTENLENKLSWNDLGKELLKDKTFINLAGKFIGGYVLYKLGRLIGGEYAGIVGAYVGLTCNYYRNQLKNKGPPFYELEMTFKKK